MSIATHAPPEEYRTYLRHLVERFVAPDLRAQLDLSGVVQETLYDAYSRCPEWGSWPHERRAAWLRTALAHNATDAARKARAARRSGPRAAAEPDHTPSPEPTPSWHAVAAEEVARLVAVLAALPEEQRRAVELHHLHGMSLQATADALGRTVPAVAGLVFRGLRALRTALDREPSP